MSLDKNDDSALLNTMRTDGLSWASEFIKRFGDRPDEIDEDLMLGWFANAIEAGRTAGAEQARSEAIGWTWAKACTQLDAGEDPRRFDMANLLPDAQRDLS
jgi:hypothetical protein